MQSNDDSNRSDSEINLNSLSDDPIQPVLRLEPIGIFRSDKKYPYETASQGSLDQSGELGLIELFEGQNFEQAMSGLSGMSHLWVLFWLHQKQGWKPMVMVPRGTPSKMGVFATRSPHRPNPLGLSLVQIHDLEQRKIWVKGFDLLNETPIFDLKPYHPEADVAENPKIGWMQSLDHEEYALATTPLFDRKAEFLFKRGVKQLVSFCNQQLRFDPFNSEKKRVVLNSESDGVLAYRTWRVHFHTEGKLIRLETIRTGYTEDELRNAEDKWGDKQVHLEFVATFGR